MINEKMRELGANRSTIRELYEYGRKMKAELGEDSVFDYSLGNPSVEPPIEVKEALSFLIENTPEIELHGYTSADGDPEVRRAIAEHIAERFDTEADPRYIYMTVGAAAALTATIKGVVSPGESVIVISPFFPEYKVFIEAAGAVCKQVPAREKDFGLDIDAIKDALDETVGAIIVNSPNNPTGAVYSKSDIKALSDLLTKKSKKYEKTIYIIADEPYRELVYDGIKVPFIPKYYDNTVVCYSFSKSLSLPGERIGYVFVSPSCEDRKNVFRAIAGAGRSLGFVCAPSLFQRLVPFCLGKTADLSVYEENKKILYDALTSYGYEVVYPEGAFYLFVKSPIPSAEDFSDIAKKYGLLLVPSNDFGCEGYVRLAYCQSTDMIRRSLPAFEQLIAEFAE